MPEQTPTYDLMLLLSTSVDEDRRAKVLSEVEGAISAAGGSIVHNGDWGTRPMTYPINHENEAEYHLLQFNGPVGLLESLGHSLGITDGVLRFRIIKVLPGTPPPPRPQPVVGIVQRDLHLEVAQARACILAHAGRATDLRDAPDVLLVRNRVHFHFPMLSGADADDFRLAYIGFRENLREVRHDRDHRAGIIHRAGDHHLALVRVQLHDLAIDRRHDRGVRQVRLGLRQHRIGLADALLRRRVRGARILAIQLRLVVQLCA